MFQLNKHKETKQSLKISYKSDSFAFSYYILSEN